MACDARAHERQTIGLAGPLVAQLAAGTVAARSIEARTSVAAAYSPCTAPDSLASRVRCASPTAPDAATLQLSARAAALVRDSMHADALHASALVDLHWGDPAGNSLSRSLQSLRQAARYEQSAAAWADLAAAELARADRDDEPRARLSALDAAVRAVSMDSMHKAARFNLALAAERLGLDGRAREEWMRYLALDHDDDGWSGEARRRIAAIDRRAVPSARGALDSARIHSLATRDPGALRLRVFTEELRDWSSATLANQPSHAAAALAVVQSAGNALATLHGDSTLLDVATEIAAQPLAPGVAEAAGAFAAGQRAAQEGRYAAAESLFARGAAAGPTSTIAAWSRAYEAIQQVYTGKTPKAIAGLRSAVADARAHRRPALEARAGWTLGVVLFRAGRREEAGAIIERVARLSALVGDDEGVAAVDGLRGEDRYAAGDERTAWRLGLDAMSTLRGHRASLRLRNALNLLAWAADDRGLSGAAAVIRDEDAGVALASGHPEFHAEALLAAARSRLLQGDTARALLTLRDVERSASTLPASDVSLWLAARAAQLRAAAGAPVSRAALDSAVSYFGSRRNGVLLVDALLTRAQAVAALDAPRAEQDLDSALALMKSRASQYRSSAERRALERRIHDIAARSALAYLARHEDMRALAAVEHGRAGMPEGLALGRGIVILDFLLVGDTLVTWRLGAGGMVVVRELVPARAIAFAREQLVRSAESGAMDRRASIALYDMLLRKHRAALRGASEVAIVADDDLAGIPFAALYDSSGSGAYLVEQASVQVASRLNGLFSADDRQAIGRALFVSDPAFDRAAFPGLASLPGARTEVDASRRFYASPVVLAGGAATTSAVSASMMKADLVHFASHASFDPERPEQSRLALAPDGAGKEGLTARTISGMRLGGVRLAVLSSCESTRSGVADAPLTIGLAKAFHDAGVPAVVGALWRVDDQATAALMTEFHRRYSATRDAARSLRDAQLTVLRGSRAEWRDPAAWGAFVFTGR